MKSTLDKFYQLRKDWYYSDPVSYDSILYFKSVEKELKAFDIIHDKRVNVYNEIIAVNSYEEYLELYYESYMDYNFELSEYDWNFLKGMFVYE